MTSPPRPLRTAPLSLPAPLEDALERLTSVGQPLEIRTEPVNGVMMKMFANRPRHLAALLDTAAAHGDRECLVDARGRQTYREVVTAIRQGAAGLRDHLGVSPGSRVALLAANRSDWVIAMWAILYAGATVVALNGWWTEDEIGHALQASQCTLLIGDRKRLERIHAIDGIQHITLDSPAKPSEIAFTSLLSSEALEYPVAVEEHDIAAIMFTSGTTGQPNGALISHRAWIAGLMNSMTAIMAETLANPRLSDADQDVRVLASLPFFHVGGGHGVAIAALASGATIVIPPEKFEPATTLALFESERISRWSAVPAMVQAVCTHPGRTRHDLSALRTLGYGAAPSGSALQDLAHQVFPGLQAISNAYGLTETGSVMAMNTGEDLRTRPDSVGRPFPTAEIRITDDDDTPLAQGTPGNIQIRGPFLMTGYLEGQEDDLFAPDRWLRTGDVGYVDTDGFIYLVDRKKDVIIRGGENIFAGEVERRLELHPAITEAAVVAAPSERLGEEVRAIIHLESGRTLSADEVRDWTAQSLAQFKIPSIVEFSDHPLPRNAAGKLLKRDLRGISYPAHSPAERS